MQTAASGEVFDAAQMTAAHRTLPFGTSVRVRRVDSGDSVVVRINDRGPWVGSRIIDVSEAAAHKLGMHVPGVVRVTVEVLGHRILSAAAPVPFLSEPAFGVQAGSFRNVENARRMRAALEAVYGTARIMVRPSAPGLWCVVVGEELSASDAQVLAAQIRDRRKENAGAYPIRLGSGWLPLAD